MFRIDLGVTPLAGRLQRRLDDALGAVREVQAGRAGGSVPRVEPLDELANPVLPQSQAAQHARCTAPFLADQSQKQVLGPHL